MRFGFFPAFLFVVLLAWSCQTPAPRQFPKRELRAVWIATVNCLDFPSEKGISVERQKEELIYMLDYCKQMGINAVFFQVRSAGDAFYASDKEPWAEWIAGEQGKAPDPFYDPLAFAIEECHKRNMELHAWFNPYRAVLNAEKSKISDKHISKRKPDWVIEFDNKLYLDPGIPAVRTYVTDVILEVVRRYDVDGIHFDDYFYPTPVPKKKFPDENSYTQYGKAFTDKNAWRRNNVDLLIKMVSESIRLTKPKVKFGISPLGVWRHRSKDSRGSRTSEGIPAYDELHADALNWLKNGWIDYVAPQLYWSIDHPKSSYKELVQWWAKHLNGRHLYIGHATYKMRDRQGDKGWASDELQKQLLLNRSQPLALGSIFFSAKDFLRDLGQSTTQIKTSFFQTPALIPAMPWKDNTPPTPPTQLQVFRASDGSNTLQWKPGATATDGEQAAYFVVYKFEEGQKADLENARAIVSIQPNTSFKDVATLSGNTKKYYYAVTACDRLHNESPPLSEK